MPGEESDRLSLKRFCFTGVRGVGKSTIVARVIENVPHIHFVSGSGTLQEMMGDDYSFFEYLPEEEKYSLRVKLNELLHQTQQNVAKNMVVDSHLTVYNLKTGIIDTIFTKKDIKFYTDIILLDSNPEQILDHRSRDTTKKRILEPEIIACELETERQEAHRMAEEHDITLHTIKMGKDADEKMINVLCEGLND